MVLIRLDNQRRFVRKATKTADRWRWWVLRKTDVRRSAAAVSQSLPSMVRPILLSSVIVLPWRRRRLSRRVFNNNNNNITYFNIQNIILIFIHVYVFTSIFKPMIKVVIARRCKTFKSRRGRFFLYNFWVFSGPRCVGGTS